MSLATDLSLAPGAPTVAERRFWAMGSDAHVIVVGGSDDLLDRAANRIEQLEARWSRFRDDSEVSILNRNAGEHCPVSADTMLMIERSVELWRITGAAVDPLVLGAVQEAGYDHSFEVLAELTSRPAPPAQPAPWTIIACTDIEFDAAGSSVRLPRGAGFDPGGIGKGLAADLVVAELLAGGAQGACVNLGGDLRVGGDAPQAGGWVIALEHPFAADPLVMLDLGSGAVATSSIARRTWTMGGVRRHHLIDTATGQPSTTDLVQASVVAGQAWVAEGLAKAVLLRGSARGFDLLPDGIEALAVDNTGIIHSTPGLCRFVERGCVPHEIQHAQERGGRTS